MPPLPLPLPGDQAASETDNSQNDRVSNQKNCGICYAHAIANVVIEVLGRACPNYKLIYNASHCAIVKEILSEFPECDEGQSTNEVLAWICPRYNLKYQTVSASDAKRAVESGRVIVGCFRLNKSQWVEFCNFEDDYSKEKVILDWCLPGRAPVKNKAGITSKKYGKKKTGHAVAIVGYSKWGWDPKGQCYVEYWSDGAGDNGYYRVALNAAGWYGYYDVTYNYGGNSNMNTHFVNSYTKYNDTSPFINKKQKNNDFCDCVIL